MKNIRDLVAAELDSYLDQEGYELYHVGYDKEGRDYYLRVFIENKRNAGEAEGAPISIEDCEKVSNFLSGRLDELDITNAKYYLEVSSPGLDRQLYEQVDFERFIGREVEINLYKAFNGVKQLTATLVSADSEKITTSVCCGNDSEKREFLYKDMAKVRLVPVFNF